MSRFNFPQWRHRVFVYYVTIMVLVFLLPVPANPFAEPQHVDKLVHFGIFLGFALLLHVDRESGVWRTFLLSVAFAGAIELVQWAIPYREGDWLDFVAGSAGAALAAVLVLVIQQQANRVAARSVRGGQDSQR
jgi:VanZ family protein